MGKRNSYRYDIPGYTCPIINSVINMLDEIASVVESLEPENIPDRERTEIHDLIRKAGGILDVDIRTANEQLRDAVNDLENDMDAADREESCYIQKIKDLESYIDDLKGEIRDLDAEYRRELETRLSLQTGEYA